MIVCSWVPSVGAGQGAGGTPPPRAPRWTPVASDRAAITTPAWSRDRIPPSFGVGAIAALADSGAARRRRWMKDAPLSEESSSLRFRLQSLALAGLCVVILGVGGSAVWSSKTTNDAASRSVAATRLSDAYEQARYSVGAEESLE